MLKAHGFTDVRIVQGVKRKKKLTGVALAHLKTLRMALEECDGPFLILEEDVEIYKFNSEVFVPKYTDAIYLGVSTWGLRNGHGENEKISFQKYNGGLYRIFNMLAAHAILYTNRGYAEFVADNIPLFIEMETNQDKLRAETMKYFNVYALGAPIFYQGDRFAKSTKFDLSDKHSVPLSYFYK